MEHAGAQGPSWVRPLHPSLLIPPTRGHPPWAVNAARTLSPGVAGLALWSLKGAGVGWAFFHQLIQLGPALSDAAFLLHSSQAMAEERSVQGAGEFLPPSARKPRAPPR